MNIIKYGINTKAFEESLNKKISKINSDFINGKIKNQTEYMHSIKDEIYNYCVNYQKPNFKNFKYNNIPYKDYLTNSIDIIKDDMETILLASYDLSKIMVVSNDDINENISILNSRSETLINKMQVLEKKISNLKRDSSLIFGESFNKDINTFETTAEEFIQKTFCDISMNAITLPIKKQTTLNSDIDIEILDTSNGFPGNTHEVYYWSADKINFVGEENPQMNLENIKRNNTNYTGVDLKDTSWFEFEMYNLNEEDFIKYGNLGFKYKENISWIKEDNKLILNLKLTLKEQTNLNNIVISAIPNQNKDVAPPILKNITISDDYSITQSLNIEKSFDNKIVLNFTTQSVKYIYLYFEQDDYYKTKVCRHYSLNIDPLKIPKFLDNEYLNYIKYDKPIHSIESLNLKYNSKDKKIVYPNTANKDNFIDKVYAISKLFDYTDTDLYIKREIVNANRYLIGLSEINVKYREYEKKGIYISPTYNLNKEIKKVVLVSDDNIPKEFDVNFEYIKYFISFDGGTNYIKISPKHKSHLGSCCIIINSNEAILNRNKNAIYYDTLLEVKEFKVRIELERDEAMSDKTPLVYNYFVNVLCEED